MRMAAQDETKTEGRGRFARKRAAKDAPRQRSLRPLRMVWQAGTGYPGHVALALVALFITAAATLAIPAGFKMVIDRGFAEGATPDDMARWFRYLLMIVAVLAAGTAMRFYYVSWLGERVVADIRLRVQENLLRLAPGFYEENSPKEISSRMTSDTALIEQVVGTTVSVALRNALMAIGGTLYLFWLVPGLTMGLLLIIPAIVVPITLFGRRLRKVSRTSQDRVADIGAMVTEVLSAMKIVQGFNQEGREHGRFREAVERTFAVARRRVMLRAAMTAVVILLVFGGITRRPYPSRRAAACRSAMSLSAIPRGSKPRRSAISASRSSRAKRWPSSAPRVQANRPSSSSPSGSTIRRPARFGSTASR